MSDDTRKAQDDAAAMLLIDLAFLLPPGTDLQRITTLLIAYRHAVTAHTRDEDPLGVTSEQPPDARGRLMLNAYGRQCYDAGRLAATPSDLEKALRDLLDVIAADNLIPESVSYMRQARAALPQASASAPPEKGHVLACMSGRHSFYRPSDGPERCRWCGASASALSPEPRKDVLGEMSMKAFQAEHANDSPLHPHDIVRYSQMDMDAATKTLHVEIERLRGALSPSSSPSALQPTKGKDPS